MESVYAACIICFIKVKLYLGVFMFINLHLGSSLRTAMADNNHIHLQKRLDSCALNICLFLHQCTLS